jgi:putative peptidoglycan lipid II flippase
LWPNLGKIVIAAALMGIVVWGGVKLAGGLTWPAKVHDLVVVLGLIPLSVAVYGALLWVLKIEGRDELGQILAKLRNRSGLAKP